jgi:MFS family permease
MLRLLASIVVRLIANAFGLFMASVLLSGFSINGIAFITAVLIFTIAEVVLDPLILKIALTSVPALRGGVALVTTLVGLIITDVISSGLTINGLSTWVLSTLIVWLAAVIAIIVLPLFVFKKTLEKAKQN